MTAEARWAEARARLDRLPQVPPHRQAARLRHDRRAARLGAVLVLGTAALAVVLLLVDPPWRGSGEPTTWRAVTGFTVGLGGAVLIAGARLARPYGRRASMPGPLQALDDGQRAALRDQVRGRAPVRPETVGLARLQADWMCEQRTAGALQEASAVVYLGFWTASWLWWAGLLAAVFLALAVTASVPARRDAASAERFLAEHPDPTCD